MAVGIDINIDPSGAVSGGRVATTSLDQIEKAADGVTRSTSNVRDELNAMSAAALKSSQRQTQYAKTLQTSTTNTRQLTTATDSAGNSLGKFNGFVGQAGFQLSDIAIQLGAGANAAMVFGIQGGQLLGFLNPIAGALATVSGILIGQFTGGMYAGAEATRELDDALTRTNTQINELSQAQARLAQASIAKSLSSDYGELNRVNIELAIAKENAKNAKAAFDDLSDSQIIGKGIFLSAAESDLDAANKSVTELTDKQEILQDRIEANTEVSAKYGKVLSGNKLEVENTSAATERYTNSILSLSQNIIVLQTRVAGNNREAAIQEAVFRSGAKAGSEYASQIALLAGQQFDLQQQLKVTNDEVKEYDKDGQYLKSLKQQAEAVSLSAREQAVLRAEYALSENATAEQIEQAKQLAGAIYDARTERKQQSDAERTYQNALKQVTPDLEAYAVRMSALTDAHRSGVISTRELSVETAKLTQQFDPQNLTFGQALNIQFDEAVSGAKNMEASLGEIYGNTFSTLSSSIGQATADMLLFGTSGEDAARQVATAVAGQLISSLVELGVQYALNAALGETIAAASLAATSASAAATASAWATPAALASLATLGTNAAPASAAVTGTVTAAQGVALSTSAIPAFAEGGLAYGPGTGTSDSFTAKLSNGEFVMPARETSRNLGTLQSMRAGNDVTSQNTPNIKIVNQTTGKIDNASAEWVSRDELQVILSEEVPNIVAGEFNNEYSQTNRAYQSQYTAQRKL